ncbi:MAG: hypothetical protein K6B72_00710 [Lachnospiraceae bacterium]|nr:hypothetical protein [Lachnospiraceae bacterium]
MQIIFWAGDSTSAVNTYLTWPQTGIAQAFDRYAASDVLICSHAVNGRSTKSFIDEGRLDKIDGEIRPGDFLFILPVGQTDNSHLKYSGAMLYAGMIADGLKKLGEPYASLVENDPHIASAAVTEING